MSSLQTGRREKYFPQSFRTSCVFHFIREEVLDIFLILLYYFRFGPFFTEPVIAGIEEKGKVPFICSMDLIGCINFAKDFVVAGTASANLYGICESLFVPDMVNNFLSLG